MNRLRVRMEDGRIVELVHFQFRSLHLQLLRNIQTICENQHIECWDGTTTLSVPVFKLDLDPDVVRALNV